MNKQELIEKYKTKGEARKEFPVVAISDVLKDLRELDKPEKVKVPQFVADWIEECGTKEKSLLTAILYTPEKVNSWVGDSDNQELFARAWLDGYEVEKEPKYIVKLKGVGFMSFLNHDSQSDSWSINSGDNGKFFKTHHTRKELEDANFGWVLDCPGIEIEEVTE